MRVNLEDDEHMVAALPKIWAIALGFMGFFNKNKEGILVLAPPFNVNSALPGAAI